MKVTVKKQISEYRHKLKNCRYLAVCSIVPNVPQLGEEADLTAQKMKVSQMFNTPQQFHSSTSAAFLPNPCYMPCLSHGSLFSGIGGFELGAKEAGIETIWSCEYEQFNRDILKKNFPNTKQYENIIDMEIPEYVDIISGGFPCQDISIANTNADGIKGKRSSSSRSSQIPF